MRRTLPSDIIRLVLGHLDSEDILSIRMTCRDIYDLSNLRSVWEELLQRLVINQNIPIPGLNGRNIDTLSSKELEGAYYKAVKLRRNWTSETPIVKRSVTLDAIPQTRIVALHVLPGRGRQFLVSLSMAHAPRRFIIRCWDLQTSNIACIASREILHFGGMVVNEVASDSAHVAVVSQSGIEILTIDHNATNPRNGFVQSSIIQTRMRSVHYLHGLRLVTKDSNGGLFLLDLRNPRAKFEVQHNMQGQVLLDFILTDTFMMILNAKTLEFYSLPSSSPTAPTSVSLFPIFQFQWPWKIDYGAMTLRHISKSNTENINDPITIFIRFGSMFPWPVNLLHCYEIRPNPYFTSSEPPSEMNVPYEYPPTLCDTIGSPIRLHAPSDLVLGPYGTAIWTDSHTESYYNHADRGQRVAGTVARLRRQSAEEEEEVEPSAQVATSTASSVYGYHEEDNWVRLAIDESEGRIFVGRDDGKIEIFEYI